MKRRKFILQTSCAAVGSSTMLSTLLNLKASNAASMASSSVIKDGGYKAMVCILLGGGNDSFNMLMPRSGQPYEEYKRTRSNLALNKSTMLPISRKVSDGKDYGLHPSLINLHNLYNQGKAAFLTNIGTLVEPLTADDFHSESKQVPLGLLSHSDQVRHWQTGVPQDRQAVGWGGKVSDLIGDMNGNERISMNISLAGSNVFQTGRKSIEYSISPENGLQNIRGYNDNEDFFNRLLTSSVNDLLDQNYADIYEKTYTDVIRNSKDAYLEFSNALEQVGPLSTRFSNRDEDRQNINQGFQRIAESMSVRNILDFQRQTFFLHYGGWDHHDEVLMTQADQFAILDEAIGSFQQSLVELGLEDSVTTFVISDFARTLTSNGNGTDHAWGGNVFVIGGNVKGGDIYGRYPSISLSDKSDLGGGIFVPEISADEYFAELAMWFGVSPTDLPVIFPNIGNFYDINSGQYPIGFLS